MSNNLECEVRKLFYPLCTIVQIVPLKGVKIVTEYFDTLEVDPTKGVDGESCDALAVVEGFGACAHMARRRRRRA